MRVCLATCAVKIRYWPRHARYLRVTLVKSYVTHETLMRETCVSRAYSSQTTCKIDCKGINYFRKMRVPSKLPANCTVYGVYTLYRQLLLQFLVNPFETLQLFSGWSEDMHIVFSGSWNYFFLHFNLDIISSLYATDMYREYMPCIGNPAYSFRPILLKLYRYFAAFLWFHMRNLSLAGYNCSGGASCMACSFI